MPRTRSLVAILVFSLAQTTLAQTPSELIAQLCPAGVPDDLLVITGTVRNAMTDEPVPRARVRISTPGDVDAPQRLPQVDRISRYVTADSDGTYAICGAPRGSRTVLHASYGDRASRFVGLFFLGGGVSTGSDFYPLDTPIWRQDLDLLPPEQRSAVVIGQVTDTTGAPVIAADVHLVGSQYNTRTDALGRFVLTGLAPGVVRLRVRRLGFRDLERDVQLTPGDTVDLSTSSLEHLPIRLAELTVTAEAPSEKLREVGFYDRRQRDATGSFLTMAEYRARWGEPFITAQVLHTMVGVRSGNTSTTVRLRRCEGPPAVFVDGWYMGTGDENDINFLVPPDWLEAVEAHQLPRLEISHNPRGGCGAIYLWTKPLESGPEEDMPVEPGARVRVTAPAAGLRRYVGEYVAGGRDTVYLREEVGGAPLGVPLAEITSLELSTGEKRRRLLGTGVGLAVGAAVGFASETISDDRALSALVLAVPGSFVGFIVGSVLTTDRWEETVQTHLSVGGFSAREARVGLAASLRF